MKPSVHGALIAQLAAVLLLGCSGGSETAGTSDEDLPVLRVDDDPNVGSGGAGAVANSPTRDVVAPTYVPRTGALRLTRAELDNTLSDILGLAGNPSGVLAEDEFSPFDNSLATQAVSGALVAGLQVFAEQVAAAAIAPDARTAFMPCEPANVSDAACFEQTVRKLGTLLLRRSLSDAEVARYAALLQFAEEQQDFYAAVALLLESLLQDPEFVYRIERGTATMTPEVYALRANEIATRLAFLVHGSGPTAALLGNAALTDPAGRGAALTKLLDAPRARQQLNRFHAMWLGYRAIPHDAALNAAFQMETQALIERTTFDGRPISDLFSSPDTYLNDALAGHYGLPLPAGGEGWVTYPADSGRAGILSHGSVLSGFSKFTDTSPTQRGIFVQTRLLCNSIPKPPPTVDIDQPPAANEPGCKVERYEAHKNQPGCVECHTLFDPIGLGLENFDMAGRYRLHDDGAEQCLITTNGTLPNLGDFRGPGELAQLLVANNLIESCFAEHYARFALGKQQLDAIDEQYVSRLTEQLTASNGVVTAWLATIVADPAFALRRDAVEQN